LELRKKMLNEHGNRKRAAEYQLNALHDKTAKVPKGPPGEGGGGGNNG